jgi:transglutaminase-like putative cysteine protease
VRAERLPLTRLQSLALSLASFLLLAVATMALGPLITGGGWWWLCAFMAAGTLGTGAALRALRTPPSLIAPLELLAVVVLLTMAFGGSSAFAFVVPTGDTFEVFRGLAEAAQRTIEQQSVPAIPVPALLFALAVGTGLLAIVMDLIVQTFRLPALAAAPALVPIVIPGLLIEAGAELGTVVLTAAAYLLLLRVDVRVRRNAELHNPDVGDDAPTVVAPRRVPIGSTLAASLGLATAGLLAASVLTIATPSVSSSFLLGTAQGTLFARGVSPYVDLGRDLRRPDPVPAFNYLADEGDRPYFTLLTIDRFEGEVWGATERAVDGDNTIERMPRPDGLAADVAGSEHPISIRVEQVRTTWLPVPYPTTSIQGLDGSWFWDDGSLNVRTVDSSTFGQTYEVTRLALDPTPQQLRGAGAPPAALADSLALPDDLPDVIRTTTEQVTAGAASPYDAAVLIQQYLRGPDFTYSVDAPVSEGYDGGGYDVIAEFLEKRAGYCVHFASTMAVMAREVGIPSRISVGYTSGTPSDERIGGTVRVDVDSHDLHAWPELYFQGVGWVQFEPTPGRGTVPSYSRPGAGEESLSGIPLGPSSTPGANGRPEGDPDRNLAGQAGGAASAASEWMRNGTLALVMLLLVTAPALVRSAQRQLRLRRVRGGPRPAGAAWDELVASAVDLGIPADARGTPRALAALVSGRAAFASPDAAAALVDLRDAVERERYGPDTGGDLPPAVARAGTPPAPASPLIDALGRVRSALAADAPPAERARATFLPRSLLAGARGGVGRRAPRDA